MKRSIVRQVVMQLLYERLLGGDGGDVSIDMVYSTINDRNGKKPPVKERQFVYELINGVTLHQNNIDALIGHFSVDWPLERMARVDLSILRLCVYEMHITKSVPAAVAINEAVELANTFSEPDAGRFINGILGSIHRMNGSKA